MAEKAFKMIPIGAITILPDIQVRIKVNDSQVEGYTAALKDDVDMDPIDLFEDKDGRMILGDGMHRWLAYGAAKREKIPANVHDENPEDAISEALEFSIRRNCHHGLMMSSEDKRRAVALALSDKIIKRKSDRSVAQLCGVSPSLVTKIRANPSKATEPRKKPTTKKEKAEKPAPATKSAPVSRKGPEFVEDNPVQERFKMLKEWKEAGYLDWPVVANMFSTKTHTATLQPNKVDGLIVIGGGKRGTIAIKSLKFFRKGDKYFVECERDEKASAKSAD